MPSSYRISFCLKMDILLIFQENTGNDARSVIFFRILSVLSMTLVLSMLKYRAAAMVLSRPGGCPPERAGNRRAPGVSPATYSQIISAQRVFTVERLDTIRSIPGLT